MFEPSYTRFSCITTNSQFQPSFRGSTTLHGEDLNWKGEDSWNLKDGESCHWFLVLFYLLLEFNMAYNIFRGLTIKRLIVTFGCLLIIMGFGKAILFSYHLARSDDVYAETVASLTQKNETGESDCLVGSMSEEGAREVHLKTSAEVFANVVKVFMGMWVVYTTIGVRDPQLQVTTN